MTTATKASLFTLTDDLLAIDALLTELEGESTPEIDAWKEEYAGKLAEKADGIGWWAKSLQNEAEFFKSQAADLTGKQRRAERKLEWLKGYIAFCLAKLGEKSVKGQVYTLALQKNGGQPPLRILPPFDQDPSLLPEPYQRITISANKEAIRDDMERMGGMQRQVKVPHMRDPQPVAEILPVGESVRIR